MRVKRLCGHTSTRPETSLCNTCLTALRSRGCALCEGYVVPLPPCPCRRVYDISPKGSVLIPCQVCQTPSSQWDMGEVVVGHWAKVPRHVGFDLTGEPLYEEKMMPMTRRVLGCKACREGYDRLVRLTPVGRTAFVDLS
jgi:hypothetical protein